MMIALTERSGDEVVEAKLGERSEMAVARLLIRELLDFLIMWSLAVL